VSLIDICLFVILGLWLSATVLKHLPESFLPDCLPNLLKSGLGSLLLPSWNFFAPRPGVHIYHVLYRDQISSGQIGAWREVQWETPQKRWLNLWNPSKTANKALIDLANELAQTAYTYRDRKSLILISMAYLSVLAFITGLPRLEEPRATQFLLIQSTPDRQEILFLSDLHAL